MTTLTYSEAFVLPHSASTVVKAIAGHADRWMTDSEIAESEFTTSAVAAATPVIDPDEGICPNGQAVSIESATALATIYYTLDGTGPDENSLVYDGPFVLPQDATTTIKAFAAAVEGLWLDSEIATGTVTTVATFGYVGEDIDVCKLSETKSVAVWSHSSTGYGNSCVLDVDGDEIDIGVADVFSAENVTGLVACSLSSTKVLVIYEILDGDYDGRYPIYGCVLTIDGDAVTSGTPCSLLGDIGGLSDVCALSATCAVISYSDSTGTPSQSLAAIITVSGDAVSIGTGIYPTVSGALCKMTDAKAIVVGTDLSLGALTEIYSCVLSVSGDVISAGDRLTIQTAAISEYSLCQLSETTALLAYKEDGDGYCRVMSVSGTTVSAGDAVSLVDNSRYFKACALSETKAVVEYRGADGYGHYRPVTVSGTTPIAGDEVDFAGGLARGKAICDLSATKAMLLYGFVGYETIGIATVLSGFVWPFAYYPAASGDDGQGVGGVFDASGDSVQAGGDPAPGSWTAHFDNGDWSALAGSWDTDHWDSEDDGLGNHMLYLSELGTWVEDYRPTKVKIAVSQGGVFAVADTDKSPLGGDPSYTSGDEMSLSFTTFDMEALLFQAASAFTVTNIEFYA